MFLYSVSSDNNNKIKTQLPSKGLSVTDVVVLSCSFKESIRWFTSDQQPVQYYFRLEKVTVRCVESMLSSLYSLCLTLSDWGDGLTFSKKQLAQDKDGLQCRRSGLIIVEVSCGAHQLWQSKRNRGGETDIAHLSQWDENRTIVTRCGVLQWHAVTIHCLAKGNLIFFPLHACPPQTDGAHKGNRPTGSNKPADKGWEYSRSLFWAREFQCWKKPCHTLPLMIYSLICHMDATSILSVLLAS